MSEVAAAPAATPTTPAAPPAPPAIDMDAFSSMLNLDKGKETTEPPKAAPEAKPEPAKPTKEPDHLAAANGRKPPKDPIDPLNETDFSDEQLSKPEAIRAAAERIQKARRQALELTRAAHRAHAAAEQREAKLQKKEQVVGERETRAAAWERVASAAIDDLESGDTERFLTAVGKLSKSGDPAGFWKNAALSLAKGERLKPQQAAQAAADPELKQRLDALERQIAGRQESEFNLQVEQLKDRNLEAAKTNEATPRVGIYASDPRSAPAIRERLAEIMLSAHQQHGRPIDISKACEILEDELSVHFELSQRADGRQSQTNREKETTGPEPEAGRATSQEPPKPETTQTVPASLGSAPASASRPMDERETRAWQIRQAELLGLL